MWQSWQCCQSSNKLAVSSCPFLLVGQQPTKQLVDWHWLRHQLWGALFSMAVPYHWAAAVWFLISPKGDWQEGLEAAGVGPGPGHTQAQGFEDWLTSLQRHHHEGRRLSGVWGTASMMQS